MSTLFRPIRSVARALRSSKSPKRNVWSLVSVGQKNRYVTFTDATKSINEALVKKRRVISGIKGYVTNMVEMPATEVVAAYHQLRQIENSFRMSKPDLQARPIHHRKRDSIDAHLSVVFAALSVSRWVEPRSGWSIKRLVKPLRCHRVNEIEGWWEDNYCARPVACGNQ